MSSQQLSSSNSTSSHPPSSAPDPTNNTANTNTSNHASQGGLAASTTAGSSELAALVVKLRAALRTFSDFPKAGIQFEDILPIFANHDLHQSLIKALQVQVQQLYGAENKPDIIVGLEARGFLFGPSLALQMGAGFVPVRKQGKLPGPTETASYEKEYGTDFFQIQSGAIKPGQRVLIVDDIIATGGSAQAAGSLVRKAGGHLLGYVFMMELEFLHGRDKLDAPVTALLATQTE